MRRFVPTIMLATALVLYPGGPAQARRDPLPYRPTTPTIFVLPVAMAIAGFDGDGDTRVTRAEFDAGVAREWRRADVNGDGNVGAIEHGSWAERTLGSQGALPGLLDLDADGDDRISRDEFVHFFAQRFLALDKDKDGVLSRSELISLRVDPGGSLPPAAPGTAGEPGAAGGKPGKPRPN